MSNIKSDFEVIRTLGEPALLEQLAEECSELAQAALKLARLERGENPTPKTEDECVSALNEEMADVCLCMDVVRDSRSDYILDDIEIAKRERWSQRIRKAQGEALKETPEEKKKTRYREFFKIFPNAVKMYGIPDFCPRLMDLKYMPAVGCENIACYVCRKCYWEAEVD